MADKETLLIISMRDIEQTAGKALGYPWYCDDLKNFPNTTPEDGVYIGPHTAETIVSELATRYEAQQELLQLIAKIMLEHLNSEVPRNLKGLIIANCQALGIVVPEAG